MTHSYISSAYASGTNSAILAILAKSQPTQRLALYNLGPENRKQTRNRSGDCKADLGASEEPRA